MVISSKFVPYEMKRSLLKIYSYTDKNMCGLLINPYYKEQVRFSSTAQLIFLINDMLNDLNFPQETMQSRTFSDRESSFIPEQPITPENKTSEAPPIASFNLSILFRQNASWQGNLIWMDKSLESSFRSVLELITLFDSVLRQTEA